MSILDALRGPASPPGTPGTGHQTCRTCRSLHWFKVGYDQYELGCYLIPWGRFGDPPPEEAARYEQASAWLLERACSVANIPIDAPPCPAWRVGG